MARNRPTTRETWRKAFQAYLLESFQHAFQVFVSPEEIRKGPFNRVQVSQGLLLLHRQLLETLLRGHARPLLIFWEPQVKGDKVNGTLKKGAWPGCLHSLDRIVYWEDTHPDK